MTIEAQRGAKITSLRGVDGTEWLTTEPRRRVELPGRYGFTEAEMCGWDECAPTIDAATLADGRELSDHGDVWDVPWQVLHQTDDEVVLEVVVDRLGFALRRRAAATSTGFVLEYEARATDERSLPWLWAAHPQFAAPDDLVVEVPGLERVRQVYPPDATGDDRPFAPIAAPITASAKYWAVAPALPPGAVLRRGEACLELRWSGEALRGLALWLDSGDVADHRCVAVEPATGRGDRVSDLTTPAEVALLEAGNPLSWRLELHL